MMNLTTTQNGEDEMKINPNQYTFKIGPSQYYTMLVKGGETGVKLHAGNSGSSVLGCGHWTKRSLKIFMVEDNIRKETLEKYNLGDLCEKCFPQYAPEIKEQKKYSGPKRHLPLARDFYIGDDGKVKFKRRQGSACRRDNVWDIMKISDFRELLKETPDACCKGCVRMLDHYNEVIARLKK